MFNLSPLERAVHFLTEQRTELYKKYCSGVAQVKNVLDAKKSAKFRALLEVSMTGGRDL